MTAGLAAAAFLASGPLGVNIAVVGLLVAASVAVAAGRPSLDLVLFGLPALALTLMPALYDAQWVHAVDLVGAWLLASVAVAGPTLVAPVAPPWALRRVAVVIPAVPTGSTQIARGLVIGLVLLVPFAALFASADTAFAQLGRSTPVPSASSVLVRTSLFAVVLLASLGLCLALQRSPRQLRLVRPHSLGVVEWAIPLTLLVALFLGFVAVQVTVLFGGRHHVLETAGLTYAEYARHGFWQLIAAATLTLAVVAGAVATARPQRARDVLLLRVLLGSLCVLTLVIVASALHRLRVYEDVFGLTRARLAAETMAWALGGLFCLVIAAGAVVAIHRQLARVALGLAALGLLAFTLSNPDQRIAQRNVERWRGTGKLDVSYLQGLSADAVPALAALPEPMRSKVLRPIGARLAAGEPGSSANRSRDHARALLAESPPESPADAGAPGPPG